MKVFLCRFRLPSHRPMRWGIGRHPRRVVRSGTVMAGAGFTSPPNAFDLNTNRSASASAATPKPSSSRALPQITPLQGPPQSQQLNVPSQSQQLHVSSSVTSRPNSAAYLNLSSLHLIHHFLVTHSLSHIQTSHKRSQAPLYHYENPRPRSQTQLRPYKEKRGYSLLRL
jgi:hypothetical protein